MPRHRDPGRVEHVDGADHTAGAGRIRVQVQMDVDGADERGIGETEIDRPAQGIDAPFVLARCVRGACDQQEDHREQSRAEMRQRRYRGVPCRCE
jgi:hypothetical protein